MVLRKNVLSLKNERRLVKMDVGGCADADRIDVLYLQGHPHRPTKTHTPPTPLTFIRKLDYSVICI
jgi:hypothetical protein